MNYQSKQPFNGQASGALNFAVKSLAHMGLKIHSRSDSTVVGWRPAIRWYPWTADRRLRGFFVAIVRVEVSASDGMLAARAYLAGTVPALVSIPVVLLVLFDQVNILTQGGGIYLPPSFDTLWWRIAAVVLDVLSVFVLGVIYYASLRDAKDSIDQLLRIAAAVGNCEAQE